MAVRGVVAAFDVLTRLVRPGCGAAQPVGGMADPADGETWAVLAPFGPTWPGPAPSPGTAPSPRPVRDADRHARTLAAQLLDATPGVRIGLVPAASGAEALTV